MREAADGSLTQRPQRLRELASLAGFRLQTHTCGLDVLNDVIGEEAVGDHVGFNKSVKVNECLLEDGHGLQRCIVVDGRPFGGWEDARDVLVLGVEDCFERAGVHADAVGALVVRSLADAAGGVDGCEREGGEGIGHVRPADFGIDSGCIGLDSGGLSEGTGEEVVEDDEHVNFLRVEGGEGKLFGDVVEGFNRCGFLGEGLSEQVFKLETPGFQKTSLGGRFGQLLPAIE